MAMPHIPVDWKNAPEQAVTSVPSSRGWNQQQRVISDGFWRSFSVWNDRRCEDELRQDEAGSVDRAV